MRPRQRTLCSSFVLQGKLNVHSHYGSFFYGCKQHVGSKRENYISLKNPLFLLWKKSFQQTPWLAKDRKNKAYAHFETGTDENKNFIKTK